MDNFIRIPIDSQRKPNIESLINNLLTQMYLQTGHHAHLIVSKSLIHAIGFERFEDLHIMPDEAFDYGVWRSASSHGGPVIGIFLPPKQSYALESLAAFADFVSENKTISSEMKSISWMDQKGVVAASERSTSSILIVTFNETKHFKNYDLEFVPETPFSMRDLISQVESFIKKNPRAAVAYPGNLDRALSEIGLTTYGLKSSDFDIHYGWHPFHGVLEAITSGIELIVDYSMFPQVKILRVCS